MSFWAAIRVPSQRESTIAQRLERELNAVIYLPVVRERSRPTGKPIRPIYPAYLLTDLDEGPYWTVIRRFPGVIGFVMTSPEIPGRCPTSEIEKLKAATVDGIVRLWEPEPPPPPAERPKVGSKVKVQYGPLAGHEGVYASHKGAMKAKVTVFLLGREVVVEIAAGAIAAAA